MASLLDQLVSEIASILSITPEEVTQQFSQKQLDEFFTLSKCEDADSVSPLIDSLDVSCNDPGSPLDLVERLKMASNFPEGLEEEGDVDIEFPKNDPPFDGSKCIEPVQKINAEVKAAMDSYTDHSMLLTKLQELQDNLKVMEYYYSERKDRMAIILNDFGATIKEIKRLTASRTNIARVKIKKVDTDINAKRRLYYASASNISYQKTLSAQISSLNSRRSSLWGQYNALTTKIIAQQNILSNKSKKYPALLDTNITQYKYGGVPLSALTASTSNIISSSDISKIQNEAGDYSEYIQVNISTTSTTPKISFTLDFQDLDGIEIEREKYDVETDITSEYTERFLIKNNPLLKKSSFFNSVPGYSISHVDSQEESDGILYTGYYNKLSSPIEEFFTLEERGLTSNLSQLDPRLINSESKTKTEDDTDYYIKNIDTMQAFYKDFDTLFDGRREQVRNSTIDRGTRKAKKLLTSLARKDVEVLLAIGGVNLNLPEDNRDLRTAINKINAADRKFGGVMADLDSEISRIELIIEDLKPTPEKLKARLKQESSECFDKIDSTNEDAEAMCSDIKGLKGSDPFFESLDGTDPTLPNFGQLCYWREFAKLSTLFGLFPIPNNPSTLRYWPVGLVIPTPAKLVKIPLPVIWIPLISISTPAGTMVIFLAINGVFITPMVFLLSASGYKQHLVTVRGSSDKFGSDRHDGAIKKIIHIPISSLAAIDKARIGKIDIDAELNSEESTKLDILESKKSDAKSTGDTDRLKKIDEEISGTRKGAEARLLSDSMKIEQAVDKEESADDIIKKAKESIYKRIDDIGKPPLNRINKLKEQSSERDTTLKREHLAALESGDSTASKKLKQDMKSDGLSLDDKVNAYTDDILEYFDNLSFPKLVLPEDITKINPKPVGTDDSENKVTEMSSNLQKELTSDHSVKVKSMLGMNLAKHKDSLEKIGPTSPLNINVDGDVDKIKQYMKDMMSLTADKSLGKTDNKTNPKTAVTNIRNLEENIKNTSDVNEKASLEKKMEGIRLNLSDKLDSNLAKDHLSMTAAIISSFGGMSVEFNPFAPCCAKESFSLELGIIPPLVKEAIKAGLNILTSAVDSISVARLKSIFGGKIQITARDIRLASLSMIQSNIPGSLRIPKPDLNLTSATKMVSGLLGSLEIPQASFPKQMSDISMDKKLVVGLGSLLKPALRNLLGDFVKDNLLNKSSQSLETDFMNINPNDMKAFLKNFIDLKTDDLSGKFDKFYKIINSKRPGNGVDLNVLEATVFNIAPYGKTAEQLFIKLGRLKMNKDKKDAYDLLDQEALDKASKILKTALTPVVSNPAASIMVAAAGVAGQLDTIKDLHPIMASDDIPPWERLTLKNILLLVFLDQFSFNAAEKLGFFRSYL